jgi:uncharacterized membrane protein
LALRHFLLRVEVGEPIANISWAIPLIGIVLASALWLTEPVKQAAYAGVVTDNEALSIVQTRCSACHAAVPIDRTVKVAPKGIELETLENLRRYAQQINTQAVINKAMPMGNKTGMLPEERAKLGAWIAAQ